MSVMVRLQRGGRKNWPVYSIVATDSRKGRDKKFIERLGFYLPKPKGQDVAFQLNEERLNYWVGVGSQVSDMVIRLLVKNNVGPQKLRDAYAKKKARDIKTFGVISKMKADKDAKNAAAEAKKNGTDAAPAAEAAPAPAAEAAPAPAEAPAAEQAPTA